MITPIDQRIRSRRRPADPGWVSQATRAVPEGSCAYGMPSSAGDEGGAVLPQAKKCRPNAVAREAAFRRRREQGSETPYSRVFKLIISGIIVLSLAACGLTAPRSSEGFADLESLGMSDTDRVLSLSIGPALLHFAASHIDDDPETKALLKGLDGVRIRIYEIDGDAGRVAGRINTMSTHLQEDGWEPVMLVKNENEAVHMLLRMADDQVCGMTVLVSDGETEAVVINLMGEIKPQQFSDVMVALDVDTTGAEAVQLAGSEES